MTRPIIVSARVTCVDDRDVPKVVEALGRVAAGLALDGLFVSLFIDREEPDEPCNPTETP